ncbi:hypothetical protein [Clostridium perfringens]|uniref:hypothetical protein n=1 Tax=Clostridium perfringens TaxID=1502 RepID=UPI0039E9F3BB
MKKNRTFSIEEDVLDTILAYQKAKNLSNASSALERIILVELPKVAIKEELEEIKGLIKNIKVVAPTVMEEEAVTKEETKENIDEELVSEEMGNSIDDIFGSMGE